VEALGIDLELKPDDIAAAAISAQLMTRESLPTGGQDGLPQRKIPSYAAH